MSRDNRTADKQFHELRHRAQAFLAASKKNVSSMSEEDVRKLVHELDSYQIELELQNEELRNSQQELAESQRNYADLYDFAPVGYCTVNKKGLVLQANLTAADMLGVERSQLLRQPLSAFIVPDDQDIFYQHRRDLLESGEEQECELRIQSRQGHVYNVQLKSSIRKEINGDQDQFRVCLTDISSIKELEEDLCKGKKEWEKTFDAIPDIITLQDKEMRIMRANRATCTFFGVSYADLIGKYCYEIFRSQPVPCAKCPILKSTGESDHCFGTIEHTKLGKIFQISSAPVLNQQGEFQYRVHTAKDITEQKRLEKKLFEDSKMKAIGTLAGGIAHDFNNILAVIIGFSELAKSSIPPDHPAANKLDTVIRSGTRAADLVKQFLTFSRKSEHHLQLFKPHLIVADALRWLRTSLPTTVIIQQEIDTDCGKICADPTNFRQIVINLCINAFQAIEEEKGVLTITLKRRKIEDEEVGRNLGVPTGSFVVLTVSDSGCGMDEATKERIFEPYFSTKNTGKGTGLDLAVIHGIVQDYKGVIRVDSTPGKGSTFSLYFPALQDDIPPIEESITNKADRQSILAAAKQHILVVDDEPLLVKFYLQQLQSCGYTVTGTTKSEDALEKFRSQPDGFDLLVTDQTMPNLNGMELAMAVREIKPGFPVILCSGHSALVSREEALSLGIREYISKPICANKLADTVKQIIEEE